MQQVVCMLSGEPAEVDIQMRAPYIEAAIATCAFSMAALRAMRPPRIFKTHAAWPDLPVAGCTEHAPPAEARVVVVVRDPRDVMVSLFYHSRSIRGISYAGTWDDWFEAFVDGTAPVPMAVGGSDEDGEGAKSDWFTQTLGWWAVHRANPGRVLWVRYEDMLAQPLQQVRAVAQAIRPAAAQDEGLLRRIVAASSFGEMKQRHEADSANAEMRNEGEAGHFRKGRAGDWRNHLTPNQRVRFETLMAERLAGSGLESAFPIGE